jgi:hypothetical protein
MIQTCDVVSTLIPIIIGLTIDQKALKLLDENSVKPLTLMP